MNAHLEAEIRGKSEQPNLNTEFRTSPSFVEFNSNRVKNELLIFHPDAQGTLPIGRLRDADAEKSSTQSSFNFVSPPRTADLLEIARSRDRLLLFRQDDRRGTSTAFGMALFGGMTIMAAHMPRPFRILFDGCVHVGPAIFDDGGMGAGVGGHWL